MTAAQLGLLVFLGWICLAAALAIIIGRLLHRAASYFDKDEP